MTATAVLPPDVAAYLAAVRVALADLPDAERNDVLIDVEASLLEAAGEEGESLSARLGSPEDFTAELRAAAGLQPRPEPGTGRAGPTAWRQALAAAWRSPRVAAVRRTLDELAPVWWAARGYVLVVALALLAGVSWLGEPPFVPSLGDKLVGLAAIALAVAASLAIGLLGRRRNELGHALGVANVILAVAAIPVAVHLLNFERPPRIVTVSAPLPNELMYLGMRVENIYPYSRDGRLLHDVLLYDGAGRPLRVGGDAPDPLRRLVQTPTGRPLFNAFPIRYFDPGSARVSNPNAAPRTRVPRIVTPPLTDGRRARRGG